MLNVLLDKSACRAGLIVFLAMLLTQGGWWLGLGRDVELRALDERFRWRWQLKALPPFRRAAAGVGFAALWEEGDNLHRFMRLTRPDMSLTFFPAVAMARWRGMSEGALVARVGGNRPLLIDYATPPRTPPDKGGFRFFRSDHVATGLLPKEWFRGKMVLVGSYLKDAPDRFLTPLSYTFDRRRSDYMTTWRASKSLPIASTPCGI